MRETEQVNDGGPDHLHEIRRQHPERCFTGCVAEGTDCVPQAHGNVMTLEECWCGATREVAFNQNWAECGLWSKG